METSLESREHVMSGRANDWLQQQIANDETETFFSFTVKRAVVPWYLTTYR